jgi:hypothetical protein
MKKTYLLLAFFVLAASAIVSFPYLKKEFNGDNINITISEDEDELSLLVDYPQDRSEEIQSAIDNILHLQGDISLENVEVKNYETPNKQMKVNIKSEAGYFKIVLDKSENSRDSREKIKELNAAVKVILTGKNLKVKT